MADERRPGDPLSLGDLVSRAGQEFNHMPSRRSFSRPSALSTRVPLWVRVAVPLVLLVIVIAVYIAPGRLWTSKYLKEGEKLAGEGRMSDALQAFQKAREMLPESAAPRVEMVKIYLQMGNGREADTLLNSIMQTRIPPEDVKTIAELKDKLKTTDALVDEAGRLRQEDKLQQSMLKCEEAVRTLPYHVPASLLLMRIYYQWYNLFQNNDYLEKTQERIAWVERIEPDNPELLKFKRTIRK